MSESAVQYPMMFCEHDGAEMTVIGQGSASGRLCYHCSKCGRQQWGKNLDAIRLGALGGKARSEKLSPEDRQRIAEKAGRAFAEKMREKRRSK